MKKQELIILCLTACFIIGFQTAQAQWGWGGGTKGNGNVVEENRKVGSFDRISAASGLDVYVTQGNSTSVVVEADENLLGQIITEVKGGVLKMYVEKSISKSTAMKVHVNMTDIAGISSSGGSDIYSKNTISANNLKISTSGGSDVKLTLDVNELDCVTSGGSDAILKGDVAHAHFVSSGGSDIEAKELNVAVCEVRASGGSDVYVHVKEEIDANASGASDIYLYGNPSKQNVNTSGASDFHKKSW